MFVSTHFVCAEIDIFLMPFDGIFQGFCGTAPSVIDVGDQQIGSVYHVLVSFEYGIPPVDFLPFGKKGTISRFGKIHANTNKLSDTRTGTKKVEVVILNKSLFWQRSKKISTTP